MINVIDIVKYDVDNGEGIRLSIWLAGCNNNCTNCWSKFSWNPNKGKSLQSLINYIDDCVKDENIDGISLLGGDPLYWLFNGNEIERKELKDFIIHLKSFNKPIWLWTGYSFEDVYKRDIELLSYIDVLIDGKFEQDKEDLTLLYKGSSNQRVIDVQQTFKQHKIITYVN